MADVKWIKLSVDIFDNRKIKQIRKLPEGSDICLMWFQLMCLAGQINDYGQVYITEDIPYTDETLATEFDLPIQTVRLGLQIFQKFGMVEIVDDILRLSSWERYQNVEKLDKYREYQRNYHREYRERQKALRASNEENVNARKCLRKYDVNPIEEDIEKETEIDIEEEIQVPVAAAEKTNYKQILSLYNELCPSFPQIRALSDARKTAIRARLRQYSVEDFGTVFMKAEASDFLKGLNNRNWNATFDWMLNGNNFAKILDGNYDNKDAQTKSKTEVHTPENYDADLEAWLNSQK